MKKVKLIYFPLIVLLILVFVISGFVHVSNAGSTNGVSDARLDSIFSTTNDLAKARLSDKTPDAQDVSKNVRAYVESFLKNLSTDLIAKASSTTLSIMDENGVDTGEDYNLAYYSSEANRLKPAYFVQSEPVRSATIAAMASSFDDDSFYASAGRVINNVIVFIPGSKTKQAQQQISSGVATTADFGDAVLLAAHMDPSKKTPAAEDASELVMLAVMLEEIESLVKNGYGGDNDLVFLFADGRYDSSFGLYAFLHQFTGFRQSKSDNGEHLAYDVNKRIKFAAAFDALGTGDASMLMGGTDSSVCAEYAKIMGGNLSSSFASDILAGIQTDFDALKDFGISSLNLVTFGDLKNESNAVDSVSVLSEKQIRALAAKKTNMLSSVIGRFGDITISGLADGTSMVYFSVLGLFTVAFPKYVSYILGALLILLIAAAVYFSIRKEAFSLSAMLKGMVLQLLALAATMVSMFAIYFLSMLILAGFGAVVLQGILSFTYFNPGLLIGFAMFAVAMQGLYYSLFKNIFNIKATDMARGGVSIFMLVAAVFAFAYPSLGVILWLPAVLAALTMLLTSLFKNRFKGKNGQDIERMIFYLVSVAFAIPLILPTVCILFSVAPLVLAPVLLLPFMLLSCMIAPYLLALKPLMSRLLGKLPKRTIRVQRVVTEQVEDRAKKGKFTQVTSKKITKEKIAWRYRHGVAMAIAAVIASVVIMVSGGLGNPVGASVYGIENYGRDYYTNSLFDDSVVVSYIESGNSSVAYMEIHDKALFSELRYVLNDYEWNKNRDAFTKDFNFTAAGFGKPTVSGGSATINVNPATNATQIGLSELTLFGTSNVAEVVVNYSDNGKMTFKNSQKKENMVLRLPLNESSFTVKVVPLSPHTVTSLKVTYRQYVSYPQSGFLSDKSGDFAKITQFLNDNVDNAGVAARTVRYGMYFEVALNNLSLT